MARSESGLCPKALPRVTEFSLSCELPVPCYFRLILRPSLHPHRAKIHQGRFSYVIFTGSRGMNPVEFTVDGVGIRSRYGVLASVQYLWYTRSKRLPPGHSTLVYPGIPCIASSIFSFVKLPDQTPRIPRAGTYFSSSSTFSTFSGLGLCLLFEFPLVQLRLVGRPVKQLSKMHGVPCIFARFARFAPPFFSPPFPIPGFLSGVCPWLARLAEWVWRGSTWRMYLQFTPYTLSLRRRGCCWFYPVSPDGDLLGRFDLQPVISYLTTPYSTP